MSSADDHFMQPDGLGQRQVLDLIGLVATDVPGDCSKPQYLESCALTMAGPANSALADNAGNPIPPAVAAERVLKILGDARTTEEREPIGAVVSVDIELAGLRDRPVLLRWSMWRTGDGTRLHGDWLNSHLAYQLQATTDRDTTTVDLWIPLPAAAGPYFVRVDLETEGARLASGDSQPFD